MGVYLGKVYIKLNSDLAWLTDFHLVEAESDEEANSKLKDFAEKEVNKWKEKKDCRKAELKGSIIQRTIK